MDGMEHYVSRLDAVLADAVMALYAQAAGRRSGVLYSAGVDSALVAKLCQDLDHEPLLLAVGTDRSKDRAFVLRSRRYLDLPIWFITAGEDDVAAALPAVRDLLSQAGVPSDVMHLSLGVGAYLACQAAQREGVGLLLSGQGADALFAGFQKYRRVPREELPAVLEQAAQNAARRDFARDQAVARSCEIEFAAPFLTPSVVALALSIPPELKLGPAGNKLVLRELARRRGLPEFIAGRPKKAMQYSTGIERIVKRYCSRS